MKLDDIGVVIASRKLDLKGKTVTIRIGKPVVYPDGSDYYCPYEITGLGKTMIGYAGGIDSVQALLLSLKKIGAILYSSREAQSGQLAWSFGIDGDFGFPVPDSAKDLLPKGSQ